LTIHYERLIPLLVEAIKELSAEVEKLKKWKIRNFALRPRNSGDKIQKSKKRNYS
jgi:hypothetical protein